MSNDKKIIVRAKEGKVEPTPVAYGDRGDGLVVPLPIAPAQPAQPEPPPKLVKLPQVGDEVTSVKLTNLYDKYALDVLRDCVVSSPREKKGDRRRYKVKAELPQPAAYQALKRKKYTTTVESLVSDGFQAIEDVAGEVRGWYDNLPEGLQAGDRGSRLDEAANTLEGLSAPDVPEEAGAIEVVYYPALNAESRMDRTREGAAMLRAAIDALQSEGDTPEKDCEECDGKGTKACDHCGTDDASECDECGGTGKVKVEGVEDFVSELENAADEADQVDIPGMYG